jgi:hypothetical protein
LVFSGLSAFSNLLMGHDGSQWFCSRNNSAWYRLDFNSDYPLSYG